MQSDPLAHSMLRPIEKHTASTLILVRDWLILKKASKSSNRSQTQFSTLTMSTVTMMIRQMIQRMVLMLKEREYCLKQTMNLRHQFYHEERPNSKRNKIILQDKSLNKSNGHPNTTRLQQHIYHLLASPRMRLIDKIRCVILSRIAC